MANSFMVAESTNLTGARIFSLQATKDIQNGAIVAKGDLVTGEKSIYKAKCNPDEVTLDEVSEKLTLMVGKYMMESGAKKNFSYNPTETGVAGRKNETIENKYGHLLDKYMK